jgi:hypothetical protein
MRRERALPYRTVSPHEIDLARAWYADLVDDAPVTAREGWLRPAFAALALVGLAFVNLAWGLSYFVDPYESGVAEIVRTFGAGHLALGTLAAVAAVVAFRPTVGAAAFVRATAIGSALYFGPQISWSHLVSERFGLLARLRDTPVLFHPADIEMASVVLAAIVLIVMGRRGAGGEGTEFAPHRFRRSLLIGVTGMASIAVFVGIFAALGLYRGGFPATAVMAVTFALIARGMLRLRAWTIPLSLALGLAAIVAAFTTRGPAPLLAATALTPLVLLPLMVALVRATWATPDRDAAA